MTRASRSMCEFGRSPEALRRRPMVWTKAGLLVALICTAGKAWGSGAEAVGLVDSKATGQTKTLFVNLKNFPRDKIMFGQYETLFYGLGRNGVRWVGDEDRSDVRTATGDFPAVYGWGMQTISARRQRIVAGKGGAQALAKVRELRERTRALIVKVHARGGINEIFWPMHHPITDGIYKATHHRAVKAILPGSSHHAAFKRDLDDFAAFMAALKDKDGRPIPMIFRPWHEHTGGWFWWGSRSCTPEEYIALWRFTVEYVRDVKGVHNLLWAYSPSDHGVGDTAAYEKNRFPGYEYMDIVGIDHYGDRPGKYARIVVELAEKHGKVPALTECGASVGGRHGLVKDKSTKWYMNVFLKQMREDPVARRIAWALVWRNANDGHFWVPYPGHPDVPDFKAFYADPMTVFESDLPKMYVMPGKSGGR